MQTDSKTTYKTRQDKIGKKRQGKTSLIKTGINKTKQKQAKPSKTRQDKTRQFPDQKIIRQGTQLSGLSGRH